MPLSRCSSSQNHVVAPVPQDSLQLHLLNWRPWKNCPLPTGNLSFKAQCQYQVLCQGEKLIPEKGTSWKLIHSNWKGVTLEP